jgi:plasmid stabilization system protein ParE
MKKYSVALSDSAIFEIEAITDYIALDSIPNAINWHDNIKDKIRSLDSMPERCPIADESPSFSFDLHCLLVDGYRVLYRINGATVQVLHVKHPNMNR